MTGDTKQSKWDLDVKGIQRAILPFLILKLMSKENKGLIGIRIKDKIEEILERKLSGSAITTPRFELHFSVLYPMLSHMKSEERGWIELRNDSSYVITEEGKKKLDQWEEVLKAILGDLYE